MGLKLMGAEPGEVTADEFAELKGQWIAEVACLCGGEEVLAAAAFRQGGAAAGQVATQVGSRLGGMGIGMLVHKGAAMARKNVAGGLPKSVMLAVTPRRLIAFDTSFKLSPRRSVRENSRPTEVARWDRVEVAFAIDDSGAMTKLRIEPLGGGPAASLVGASSVDDPWSLELMRLLVGSAPALAVG
jgi:hypothetical protein